MQLDTASTHIYRPQSGPKNRTLLTQILLGGILSVMLCIIVSVSLTRFRLGTLTLFDVLLPLMGAIILFGITVPTIIGLIVTKLEVSPQGLKFNYWPNYTVECTWSDVDRLGQGTTGNIKYDVLYLKGGKIMELAPTMKLRRLLFNPSKEFYIPLTRMEGWPDGGLAEDIRRYAPRLFEAA